MRVVIIDARKELRSALRILLDQEPEIQVVGEAESVEALSTISALASADVLLMDWEVLVPEPQTKVERLKAGNPSLKVLVLSVHALNRSAALRGGADGFVCKCDPPEELLSELLSLRLV